MNDDLQARSELLQQVIDTFPAISFVVDNSVCVVAYNTSAGKSLRLDAKRLRHLTGNLLSCVNALEHGCGRSKVCNGCVVRLSILEAFEGTKVERRETQMRLSLGGEMRDVYLLVTAAPLPQTADANVLLVVEDVTEMATLRQLLPVCGGCGAPRADDGYLSRVQRYLADHERSPFAPWICRTCRAGHGEPRP